MNDLVLPCRWLLLPLERLGLKEIIQADGLNTLPVFDGRTFEINISSRFGIVPNFGKLHHCPRK